MKRNFTALGLCVLLLSGAALSSRTASAGAKLDPESFKDKILQEKCAFCHDAHRVYEIEPSEILTVMEKMKKKNPGWFSDLEGDHIVEVVSKILKDDTVLSAKKAWKDSLARGEKIFSDPGLGTTGSSCASCHTTEEMKQVANEYPAYDPGMNRLLSLGERIYLMVTERMKGGTVKPYDQTMVDLEVYLKSLR
jgi:cytochrome c553